MNSAAVVLEGWGIWYRASGAFSSRSTWRILNLRSDRASKNMAGPPLSMPVAQLSASSTSQEGKTVASVFSRFFFLFFPSSPIFTPFHHDDLWSGFRFTEGTIPFMIDGLQLV